jgi:LPXTG-site transpeptidase (sortase) family protein
MPIFEPKTYIKDESFDPIYSTVNKRFFFKSRVMPGLLMALGFLILGTQVVLPLIFFKTQDEVSKPFSSTVLGITSGFSEFEFEELEGNYITVEKETPEYFYLTVPKLGIEKALVETNSTDLNPDTALGHYNGSGLPGDVGNAFIYGHSVLPWFYNPNNYKTIFSTLNNLTTGDEFYIDFGDQHLTYRVESKQLLYPNEVHPLNEIKPRFLNESTMVLMTCWPAGTKVKRLLVNAVMITN